MGKKSSKTNSTTNQQTHLVQTPNNPEWSTNLISGLAGQIGDLSKADPYGFVAGADPLQQQASTNASNLNARSWNYDGALDLTRGLAQADAPRALGYIDDYMNPYLKDVVDTSLADYDFGAGQSRGQAALDLANDTTFGGSGGALYRSGLEGELTRGRGALSAGLRSQAYNTALGAAQGDAQLEAQQRALAMSGANQIGALTSQLGADERANIGVQADVGDINRQIEAARRLAPLTLLGTQTSLAGGLPLGMFTGQTQDGTMNSTTNSKTTISDPMGSIGGLLMGAGSLATGLGGLGLSFGSGSLAKAVGMPSASSIAGSW